MMGAPLYCRAMIRPLVLGWSLAALAAAPARLAAQTTTTIVILVRHAERAGDMGNDPALSPAGEARSAALATALGDTRLDGIVATQYRRTQLTAAPVARARGLTPDTVATTGGTQAHVQAVAEHVRARYAGKTVLVVGHSNTIPAIVTALGGPRMADMNDNEFSTMFVLALRGSTASLIRTAYGAPDPAPAAR